MRAALEALEAVAQDHDSPQFWELHRDVPLGAARAGRDAPGSSACSSRCGRRRSATSGCSSPRRSTTRWPTTASCTVLRAAATARARRELLRRHLDRTESRGPRGVHAHRRARERRTEPCAPRSSPPTRRRPRSRERPEPQPREGQAVVELLAAALNPADLAIASGSFPAGNPPLPYVPGIEGVGRVVESARFAAGTRVWASGRGLGVAFDGAFSRALRRRRRGAGRGARGCRRIIVAAALGQVGLAAWMSLSWLAPVRPGEVVLVLGATGSVGSVAVQAAKLLGAGRVVAAGRDAARLEAVERARRRRDRLARGRRLPRAARRGRRRRAADARARPALRPAARGRARPSPARARGSSTSASRPRRRSRSPSGFVRGKQLELLGYSNFAVPLDALAQGYADVVGHAAAGRIRLDAEALPLDRVARGVGAAGAGPRRQARARPVTGGST